MNHFQDEREDYDVSYCVPYANKSKGTKCSIADATLPFPDMLPVLKESENQPVYTNNNAIKNSVSRFDVSLTNKYVGDVYYYWSTVGSAVIIEPYDIGSEFIYVQTSSNADVSFTVVCSVRPGNMIVDEEIVELDSVHVRLVGEDIITGLAISEDVAGSCVYDTNDVCTCVSQHTVSGTGVDTSEFEWSINTGKIISGQGTTTIEVETTANANSNIEIKCIVSNSVSIVSVIDNFIHTRTENVIPEVVLTDIVENISGFCEYNTDKQCTAVSKYTATVSNHDNIWWAVNNGSIISGQGTPTIEVETTSDKTEFIEVTCTAYNSVSSKIFKKNFVHERVENLILPIIIHGILEITHGNCEYLSGTQCSAIGVYFIDDDYGDVYSWSVIGGTIIGASDTPEITVQTTGDTDMNVQVFCVVSNELYSKNASATFVHTRTELSDTVLVSDIIESIPGSCEYETGFTCTAQSTYDAVLLDADLATIVWEVLNGTIDSGQGTEQIVVSTDGNMDTAINVKCSVDGFLGGSSTRNEDFIHTRSEVQDVFDQALLYDINNIATEFIV